MRKYLFCLGLFLSTVGFIQAQSMPNHALGLRFGDNGGVGPELSYQQAISELTRYQVDFGWRSRRFDQGREQRIKLSGGYQWIRILDGQFQYYYGAGTGLLYQSYRNDSSSNYANQESSTNLILSGILGVEYTGIEILYGYPIHLGLDVRPEYGLGGYYDRLIFDVALALRFSF